jgi:hypothetical protein
MILSSLTSLDTAVQHIDSSLKLRESSSQDSRLDALVKEELFNNPVIGQEITRNLIIMRELTAVVSKEIERGTLKLK